MDYKFVNNAVNSTNKETVSNILITTMLRLC